MKKHYFNIEQGNDRDGKQTKRNQPDGTKTKRNEPDDECGDEYRYSNDLFKRNPYYCQHTLISFGPNIHLSCEQDDGMLLMHHGVYSTEQKEELPDP
jgi:hypothetical protein